MFKGNSFSLTAGEAVKLFEDSDTDGSGDWNTAIPNGIYGSWNYIKINKAQWSEGTGNANFNITMQQYIGYP